MSAHKGAEQTTCYPFKRPTKVTKGLGLRKKRLPYYHFYWNKPTVVNYSFTAGRFDEKKSDPNEKIGLSIVERE